MPTLDKKPFEMSEEQTALFNALTPLQKEISLNSISGMNDIDAYKNSSGKAKTEKAMSVSVAQILGNLSVKSFIGSMANNIVNPAIMSRDEMLEKLSVISRVEIPKVSSDGLGLLTEMKGGFDVQMKAMKQLAEMAGYEAPIKTETKTVVNDGSGLDW